MASIALFGECMLELVQSTDTTAKQSFAGDFYNTAVYLKRTFAEHQVSLFTAVGVDVISQRMRAAFAREHLDSSLVVEVASKIPGVYMVNTDEKGERSFLYWRDDSAAKYIMSSFNHQRLEQLKNEDLFFFSGISLAILPAEHRPLFWEMLSQLKSAGVTISFDPNYRARLWNSEETARAQFEQAFLVSDIVLPGLEDFDVLYGLKNTSDVISFCAQYPITELVLKDGAAGVHTVCNGEEHLIPISAVENVVDTTSAGDSFNGVYLGARLAGFSVVESVEKAAMAAGFVIQHQGAIVEETRYQSFVTKLAFATASLITLR